MNTKKCDKCGGIGEVREAKFIGIINNKQMYTTVIRECGTCAGLGFVPDLKSDLTDNRKGVTTPHAPG